jgi:hypothetical protein
LNRHFTGAVFPIFFIPKHIFQLVANSFFIRVEFVVYFFIPKIFQLYRFAVIGQSAAATLHELSNHLSILMLDFDTIKTQHKTSKSFMRMQADVNQITFSNN